jgi:hypothetical protein
MGIPLSEVLDGGSGSMREQAATNNLPHEPFTMRELITPQYEVGLDSSGETWENWVGQHEDGRTELRPETREQLVASVVRKVRDGGSGDGESGRVRAVGSGHSHSDAPAPEDTYIELNPGDPGESNADGLNSPLSHNGWLKGDDELKTVGADEDGSNGTEEEKGHYSPISESHLKQPPDQEHLKRLQSGIVLRRLNRHILHGGETAYALANMGSFDGQTIAGAVNTSTHGTGVGLPSVADAVRSVEIATVPESESGEPIVRMYRIEPENGITDRDAFEAETGTHEMELIQDDDVFHSVVVGYGCMGVVYAYTMQVVDNYWLREESTLMAWSSLKGKLGTTEESVKQFLTKDGTRHCQLLINTAAEQVPDKDGRLRQHEAHGAGQHEDWRDPVCLVKRLKVTDQPGGTMKKAGNKVSKPVDGWVNWTKDQRWPPERRAKPFRDAGKAFSAFHPLDDHPGKSKQLHNNFFHPEINKDPFVGGMHKSVWYSALRRIRDRGDENTPAHFHPPPPPPVPTTEIGVGVGDVVEAIDIVRQTVRSVKQGDDIPRENDGEGRDVFFPVPMGIRFAAGSSHFLSPEYDRDTAMVELPLPVPKEGQVVWVEHPFKKNELPLDHDDARKWVVMPALTEVEQTVRREAALTDPVTGVEPRPHMGKHNTVDADWLDQNYEYFDASDPGQTETVTGWYQAYKRFNAFGTFDNKFTEELELDEFDPAQPVDEQETPTTTRREETTTDEETTATDEETTTDDDDEMTTGGTVPGFGVLAGLAGVGTGAWLRHRDDESDDAAGGEDESTTPAGVDASDQRPTDAAETSDDPPDDGD